VKHASPTVLSLARLLEQQPAATPVCLLEPGLLPPQGILFVGGEPDPVTFCTPSLHR